MEPIRNPTPEEALGLRKPEFVRIDAKSWQGMRRQMVRLVIGWRYADKEAQRILDECKHLDGCPAVANRTASCFLQCPDHEKWQSALVIKYNAEQYSMLAKELPLRPDGDYGPPGREFFDAVVSELEVLREGRDILTDIQEAVTKHATSSPWTTTAPPERAASKLLPPEPEPEEEEEVPEGEASLDPSIDLTHDSDAPPDQPGHAHDHNHPHD